MSDNENLQETTPIEYELKTVSGQVITITDAAPQYSLCKWETQVTTPTLDGISSIVCVQSGKNLIELYTRANNSGIDYSINPDGSLHREGTATANSFNNASESNYASCPFKFPRGTYTLSIIGTNTYTVIGGWTESGTQITNQGRTGTGTITFTINENFGLWYYVKLNSGIQVDDDVYIWLSAGSTASTYEPYLAPYVTTVSLGRSINEGTVTLTHGTGSTTYHGCTLADLSWTYYTGGTNPIFIAQHPDPVMKMYSRGETADILIENMTSIITQSRSYMSKTLANMQFGVIENAEAIAIRYTSATTVPDMLQDIGSYRIVYKLDASAYEDFTFSPQYFVPMGTGTQWWTNWGTSEITYWSQKDADPTYTINGATLTDIADAIRSKIRSTLPIDVADFATDINSITLYPDFLYMLTRSEFDLTDETCPTQAHAIIDRTFYQNQAIRKVSMTGITSVGQQAFYQCKATSFNLPNCETIGYQAFYQARGASAVGLSIPKAKTIAEDAFRGAYIQTMTTNQLRIGGFNESASAGTEYSDMWNSNSQRGSFVELYPITDGMKLVWDNASDNSLLVAYFDEAKHYAGTYTSWDNTGEITVNSLDPVHFPNYGYIAVMFKKESSSYYFSPWNWGYINLRVVIDGTVVDTFRSELDLSACTDIGNNAFRDATNNAMYLPNCENLGTCPLWSAVSNYNLVLPKIKTMSSQPFRGVTFTNLVLGPDWVSCGSNWAGYDADWRGRYVYIYATTPPTMGGGLAIQNSPNAIYVPADSVDAYKAANYWSTQASVIQALPSDHLTIDTWT